MGNKRTEIRQALKALINVEVLFTGVTVSTNRRSLVSQREELPAITLMTANESATPEALQQKRYIRKLELRIEYRVDATENVDDLMDDALSQIEDFMLLNRDISGTLLGSELKGTETDVGHEGDQEIGLGVLIYECTYVS